MHKEVLYEKIEAYLNNQLPEAERRDFEAELTQDPTLAQEVQLHREITQELGNKQKMAFRKTLETLRHDASNSATKPTKARKPAWPYLLGIALLLALLYLLSPIGKPKETAPPIEPTPSQQSSESPIATAPSSNTAPAHSAPISAKTKELEKTQPATKETTEAIAPPKKEKANNPIASRPNALPQRPDGRSVFDPIPRLEAELQKEADPVYSVEAAAVRLSEKRNQASYDVLFDGLLLTAMEKPELALVLFDNRIPITEITAVIPVNLSPVKQDPNIRAFAAKKAYEMSANYSLELQPGLYYLRLQRAGDMGVLWTGKILVEE